MLWGLSGLLQLLELLQEGRLSRVVGGSRLWRLSLLLRLLQLLELLEQRRLLGVLDEEGLGRAVLGLRLLGQHLGLGPMQRRSGLCPRQQLRLHRRLPVGVHQRLLIELHERGPNRLHW
jgi:hypothetical protein